MTKQSTGDLAVDRMLLADKLLLVLPYKCNSVHWNLHFHMGKDLWVGHTACFTRLIITSPASSGWLSISSVFLENSPSSSKNKTPWCANEISPGLGKVPPPTNKLEDAEWWGWRYRGLNYASTISSKVRSGKIEWNASSSILFPQPRGLVCDNSSKSIKYEKNSHNEHDWVLFLLYAIVVYGMNCVMHPDTSHSFRLVKNLWNTISLDFPSLRLAVPGE